MKFLKYPLLAVFAVLMAANPAWAQRQAHDPTKTGVLRIGFIPAEDSRAMVRQSQAILDVVAKHTGMKIETFVGSDYNATIEAFRSGHVDVGLLGPFSYVLATTQAEIEFQNGLAAGDDPGAGRGVRGDCGR